MECEIKTQLDIADNILSSENCQEIDKILSVVVKRRKTIPTKCLEINKQIIATEIFELENAKVTVNENQEKEKFRKINQGFRRLKSSQFSVNDLYEAELKLEKYFKRSRDMNDYLQRRKNLKNNYMIADA